MSSADQRPTTPQSPAVQLVCYSPLQKTDCCVAHSIRQDELNNGQVGDTELLPSADRAATHALPNAGGSMPVEQRGADRPETSPKLREIRPIRIRLQLHRQGREFALPHLAVNSKIRRPHIDAAMVHKATRVPIRAQTARRAVAVARGRTRWLIGHGDL